MGSIQKCDQIFYHLTLPKAVQRLIGKILHKDRSGSVFYSNHLRFSEYIPYYSAGEFQNTSEHWAVFFKTEKDVSGQS